MNIMKNLQIEKVTLNIGAGKDQNLLKKGRKLIKNFTGIEPVQTKTNKRIPSWGLRPGLPIGCKLTLRKQKAEQILTRALQARDMLLDENHFDSHGNLSFGVHEYIDVPDLKYDPEIGIIGFQVSVTFTRPGYRVKLRRLKQNNIGKSHVIKREETISFMKEKFGVKIGEDS